jgi:hypothetical protein
MTQILTSNSPAPGSISWREFTHTFDGTPTTFPAGSTSKKLVYRRGTATTLSMSDALPGDWKDDDVLFFANRDGFAINATSATGLFGDLIVPGTIISQNLATGAVKATHIDADAITADAIGAGVIIGEHISAGAISTSKLSVGTVSDNLVANGSFEDVTDSWPDCWGWTVQTNGSIQPVTGTGVTASGAVAMRFTATTTGANLRMRQTPDKYIPVTNIANKRWWFSVRAGAGATTTAGFYFRVLWMDANKVQLTTGTTQNDVAGNIGLSTAYTERNAQFTPPAGARYACIELLLVNPNVATSIYVDEVVATEVTMGTQIQDLGITTGKLAAGAVTTDRLAAKAITVDKLAVGDFTNYSTGGVFDGADDLANWTISGTGISIVTTGQIQGIGCLQFAAGTGVRSVTLKQPKNVQEGDQFYIDFFFKSTADWNGTGSNSKLRIGDQTGALKSAPTFGTATTTWRHISADFTVPAGMSEMQIQVLADHTVGTAWIDSVIIRRKLQGELIVDGAITANKITASEELWAKVIGAHRINAAEIDAPSITSAVITSDVFVGKSFTGGTFTGALFQSHTDPALGTKLDPAGFRAYDSRAQIQDVSGATVTNPRYKQKTFEVAADSGNVSMVGELAATSTRYFVNGGTTTTLGDITTRIGPDAITNVIGQFQLMGVPGMSWSNYDGKLARAAIGGDGQGNLFLTSGGVVNDERKIFRLAPHGFEFYGPVEMTSGMNLSGGHLDLMGGGYIYVRGGKMVFTEEHSGAPGSNWIQSGFPIRFSGVNSTVLQSIYAANIYSNGNVHLLTDSGMARLVGNNSGGNNWISLLRDDQTGGLAGLRRYSGNNGTGFNAMPVYDLTTASAANVNISSGGWLQRSTSARKYKQDIQAVDPAVYENNLLSLQPKSWIDKGEAAAVAEYERRIAAGEPVTDPETGEPLTARPFELQRYYGYIAEDVLAAGKLGWAVTRHDQTGEVEGLAYDRLAAAVIPIVAKYRTRLTNLETQANQRVSALETKVASLESKVATLQSQGQNLAARVTALENA